MKMTKKIVACLSAITMCLALAPVNVNASTTYLLGDIDGDGSITSQDVLHLDKFLSGKESSTGGNMTERLDFNHNGVIDQNDLESVKKIVLGINSTSNVTLNSVSSIPTSSNRNYYKYTASNGVKKGEYTLNSLNYISATSTRDIYSPDDRVIESGYSGVVKFKAINESYGFTGFVIDSHTILTCAHGLCNNETGATLALSNYEICFYNENDLIDTNVHATPVEYHIPCNYVNNVGSSSYLFERYDYALVTVREDLSEYINFYLGVPKDNIISINGTAYITGINNGAASSISCRKATSFGSLMSINNYNLYYQIDTSGGESGSPIYINNNNNDLNTVIGIHTYGYSDHNNHSQYNHGTRITSDILQFVYNNDNLQY